MIDIHNHYLYDTDDGIESIEESVIALKKLQEIGYTSVVLTPHYFEGKNYCSDLKTNIEKINILKEQLNEKNVNINLYLGNEIYIDDNIIDNLNNKKITTINNSKYLLIEFPLWSEVKSAHNVIFELVSNGYIPIIAHPERYRYYHKHIEELEKFKNEGALFQANIGTLYNKYGRHCKKMLKKMIKMNMISFLGTDAHRIIEYKNLNKVLSKYIKDKDKLNNLTNINILKVINNEKI